MKLRNVLRRDRIKSELRRLQDEFQAWRYGLNRNALRFTKHVYKALPAAPQSKQKRLVLFAHFDVHGLVDDYVRYYLQELHANESTIIFTSGSPELDLLSLEQISPFCTAIYSRRTLGLDFGSWHLGWAQLQSKGWSLENFEQFALVNDSVYGPLFSLSELLAGSSDADMYGAIESAEYALHLQSFFLIWNINERTKPFLDQVWSDFTYILNKDELIQKMEVGLSKRAREAGLSQKAFISAQQVESMLDVTHDSRYQKLLMTQGVGATTYFWDRLIEDLKFPFLKTAVPKHDMYRSARLKELPAFLKQHTNYDPALIRNHLTRIKGPPHRT